MCANHEPSEGGYHSHEMRIVALSILVMGISLAIVIVLWASFGYIGPKFSDQTLRDQQTSLRDQYGLPALPPVSEKDAQTPPSLRNVSK